jgi:ATP-grasp domain/L-amino acid ligase C-terminal domain 2
LAIFDKPDPLEGPYFEETIYITPSRIPEPVQSAIERCARDAVRALGLSHGPIHAEFRINEQGVWPLEVAPRPIGGLCARSLRFSFPEETEPIGLEELLVRHALELPGWNSPREEAASGVMMIPVPKSGILEAVSGEEAVRLIPRVTELSITARLHDAIAAWPEGSSYLGFLFARGNTPEEVEHVLRQAHQRLSFKITPSLPVEHPGTRRITNQPN